MILLYHKVFLENLTEWWVDVDNFYRQMCELKYKKIVYLDDYNPNDPNQVVITFDGIYQNVLKFAAPILKDFNYPFELFVTSGYIGKNNTFDHPEPIANFTTEKELLELKTMGGRLQWHTQKHLDLKNITEHKIIKNELSIPKNILKLDNTGFKWFAYPYGNFNNEVIKITKNNFSGAVSCIQGNNKDIYKLNRVIVTNETSFKKASIAVIIPSYNYGPFLIEAIESVLKQTRPPSEILIADDYSNDNTQEIALEYQKKYPKLISYYRNEKNLGIVKNFNKGISLSKGDYVCFLGADNRFRSDYIEKTAEILDSDNKIGIAYTDFALFGPRSKIIYDQFKPNFRGEIKENYFYIINFPDFNKSKIKELKKYNFIHGSSMYKKSAFIAAGGYKDKKETPEDHNLFLRIIKNGWTAKRSAFPLLEYRQHSLDQANIKLGSYAELNFYKEQYKKNIQEIGEKSKELDETKNNLKIIYDSKFFKIYTILKKIKTKFKK